MIKIKKIYLLCGMALFLVAFIGCVPKYWHKPGGPYYFKDYVTYQGFRPNREITEQEAHKLSGQGYKYAVAYFNEKGQPIYIEGHYSPIADGSHKGKVEKYEFFYENGNDHFFKIIWENTDGEKSMYLYGQKEGWVKIP